MRVRTALAILIAVNVLWGAAFFGYIHRSTTPVMKPREETPAAKPIVAASNAPAPVVAATPATNPVPLAAPITNVAARAPKSLPSADKKFGWQDVTNETYLDYIASLRSSGCPEKHLQDIVVKDVNELFDKRRLEHAIRTDSQWWKAETFMGILPMQNVGGANFDEERRAVLAKVLGENWDDKIKLASLNSSAINLTGPVLGALPTDTWNSVQEICQRSLDRSMAYQNAKLNEGAAFDNVELAKLREATRSELVKILTPEQVEEFLLRYSHNSSRLRQDMRGIDLTPDEFRRIFRAVDPFEHQMQLDYGGPEALSPKQREQLEAQRDRAIREALTPERYQRYLATKDPIYRQAQSLAANYGLNGKAIQALYELQKSFAARQLQISQNNALTPEQRAQAMQALSLEHQQAIERMRTDTTYTQ
jgi:hypothetical protein